MKKINIAFLGTPNFVKPIKDTLTKHYTLVNSLNKADLAVVAAYGKILTKEELITPKYGAINVHPSLLPKYRGPSPIQTAILNGDKISGITIIKMDEKIDHGPIIYQETLGFCEYDNFDTLSKKMFIRASKILPKVINDFILGKMNYSAVNCGVSLRESSYRTIHPRSKLTGYSGSIIKTRVQRHAIATHCNRLTKESGYFNINNPPSPQILDRMTRAYYPWPGVWTKWNNKVVKLIPNVTLSKAKGITPGLYPSVVLLPQDDKREAQNDKFLIQMEGKKVMPLQDFLNGYPGFPLKIFNY